jgi:drug/metabolite transporter (DMT)-like permease
VSVTVGARTDNLRGALFLCAAAFVFTVEAVLLRTLGHNASTTQIVLFRCLAQIALVSGWVIASRGAILRTRRPGLQVLRALASLAAWWLYYLSFRLLDLALATTLTFATSLFVVALAAPILKEKVDGTRAVATLVGFVGVAIAAGLGRVSIEPGVIFGIGGAISGAAIVFLNRALTKSERTSTIMTYIGVVGAVATVPVAVLHWTPLTSFELMVGFAIGGLGAVGMWLTIEAYRVGEVSALAPVPYIRMIFAIVAGWVAFAEWPAGYTLAGAGLVVASALVATRAEVRRRGLAAPHR